MGKFLALLSGKGGSGKTTLSLSIASLLSSIDLKTLLVDCDFITNGATYFYEDKLNDSTSYLSFFDVLTNQKIIQRTFISISKFLDFIPAVSSLSNSNFFDLHYSEDISDKIKIFKSEMCKDYDIVIFDCQAGYTNLLKYLLPNIDETLFVMEADAISSAALRTLHLKIGDFLNNRKSYQVFNKATPEEFEIYNKISGGTFFTNIETVLFDWKIRKAFALSEIPDMEKTSAKYGEQIYNICKVLLPEDKFQKKLIMFSSVLEYYKSVEEKELLLTNMKKEKLEYIKKKTGRYKMISLTIALSSMFAVIFSLLILINKMNDLIIKNFEIILIPLLFLLSAIVIFIPFILKTPSDETKIYNENEYKKKINEITDKIEALLREDNEILSSRLR